jgi:menaquinone-dependent protoporphyrinogen oxidase
MPVLVAYASRHTATRGIAEHIAAALRARGHQAVVESVEHVDDVTPYEAVVLGSAVYYGRWLKSATEFVGRHHETLADRPVWLFSSGPLGDQPADKPAEAMALQEAIRPRDHRVFSGALDRAGLRLRERLVVGALKAPCGDFRDWDEIDAFAQTIADELPPQTTAVVEPVGLAAHA